MSGEPLDAREVTLAPVKSFETRTSMVSDPDSEDGEKEVTEEVAVYDMDKAVTFKINKLLPMEAKQLFMRHVRPLLRGALSARTDGGGNWQLVLAAFTDAPQNHYDAIQKALYRHITFLPAGQSQPKPLLNDEAFAFQHLDMAHSLILDARAFSVNFFGSWHAIRSELKALRQDLVQLAPGT